MKSILQVIPISEFICIFLLVFSFNNYIGNTEIIIKSDGEGYYDYLPATFIRKDFFRSNYNNFKDNERKSKLTNDFAATYKPYKNNTIVNKYTVGTAILMSPFFFTGFIFYRNETINGYENHFHKMLFYAAIIYLFFGLLCFKKLCGLYEINPIGIFLIQVLMVLATGLVHYTNHDASFSHVYSFFSISLFIYLFAAYIKNKDSKFLSFSVIIFTLIFLIRQINILVLLFLPFLFENLNHMKETTKLILYQSKALFWGMIGAEILLFIQLFSWYAQTGDWIVYSYQNETFNFINPQLLNFLFSFKKGLFIYSPILFFILLFSFITLLKMRLHYKFFTMLIFLLIVFYVSSSWWDWSYGCSFGQRVMVDYLAVFFFVFAFTTRYVSKKLFYTFTTLMMAFIPVNIIQAYQYKKYILHWEKMDREKYWKIFLKTEPQYEGWVWTTEFDTTKYNRIQLFVQNSSISIPKDSNRILYFIPVKNITKTEQIRGIYFSYHNEFNPNSKSKVEVVIKSLNNFKYYHNVYTLRFCNEISKSIKRGGYEFLFNFNELKVNKDDTLFINYIATNMQEKINNPTVELLFSKN